jgi:hypothetical protein
VDAAQKGKAITIVSRALTVAHQLPCFQGLIIPSCYTFLAKIPSRAMARVCIPQHLISPSARGLLPYELATHSPDSKQRTTSDISDNTQHGHSTSRIASTPEPPYHVVKTSYSGSCEQQHPSKRFEHRHPPRKIFGRRSITSWNHWPSPSHLVEDQDGQKLAYNARAITSERDRISSLPTRHRTQSDTRKQVRRLSGQCANSRLLSKKRS